MRGHSKEPGEGGTAAIPTMGLDSPPAVVLSAWGWPTTVEMSSVPPGFSGAAVWKVTSPVGCFALKRWAGDFTPDWPKLHRLCRITTDRGFPLLAQPVLTKQHQPVLEHEGKCWSATTWMPGEPLTTPNDSQLQSALRRLAELHALWRRHDERRHTQSPGIQLMLERLQSWNDATLHDAYAKAPREPLFTQALEQLGRCLPRAIQRLVYWRDQPLPLQNIVGDLWSEHVLFTGDQVTGFIDLATVRLDHVAHDLARLLGSYCQGDARRRAQALNWYPQMPDLEPLVIALDEVGAIVALGNWLRWLVLEKRPELPLTRTVARLQALVDRLQRQTKFSF